MLPYNLLNLVAGINASKTFIEKKHTIEKILSTNFYWTWEKDHQDLILAVGTHRSSLWNPSVPADSLKPTLLTVIPLLKA